MDKEISDKVTGDENFDSEKTMFISDAERVLCDCDDGSIDLSDSTSAPNLIINPIYVKLYKEGIFSKLYPLYVLSTLRVGRARGNEIHLTTPEISRALLEINYSKEGVILVSYVGRTPVNLSDRTLQSGEECTEEVELGSELSFSDYKIVFSDNDKAQAKPVIYYKLNKHKKHLPGGLLDDNYVTEEEMLRLVPNKRSIMDKISGLKHAKTVFFAGLAALIIAVILSGVWGYKKSHVKTAQQYATAQISRTDFQDTMGFPGIINFLDPVPVVNPLSGKIVSIGFKDGDHVKEGQTLFKIDSSNAYQQLQQTRSDYITAEANFRKYETLETSTEYNEISKSLLESKNNLNRTMQRKQKAQRLVDKGILSKAELERAEVDYENALTQADNYAFKLKQVEIAFVTSQKLVSLALNKAKKALEDAEKIYSAGELKSPISGIVTVPVSNSGKVVYAIGQSINSDAIVVYIGDYKNIGIKIEIAESQVRRLQEGMKVLITTEMLKDMKIEGILKEIAAVATIKENSSVFEAKIQIINNDEIDKVIKFGLSANASVIISEKPNALSIPIQAMFDLDGRPCVLYLDNRKTIKLAFIRPGLTNPRSLELLDSTLPEGTVVLTSEIEETLSKLDKNKLIEEAGKLDDSAVRNK
ncbi:MAG: efflux RND transporter periplasmic adaptor subunit [Nitrospirae bacterium]|nr:efflux RND transporter periplasmic adaptor subunit [Nitrospirota bacterium]